MDGGLSGRGGKRHAVVFANVKCGLNYWWITEQVCLEAGFSPPVCSHQAGAGGGIRNAKAHVQPMPGQGGGHLSRPHNKVFCLATIQGQKEIGTWQLYPLETAF